MTRSPSLRSEDRLSNQPEYAVQILRLFIRAFGGTGTFLSESQTKILELDHEDADFFSSINEWLYSQDIKQRSLFLSKLPTKPPNHPTIPIKTDILLESFSIFPQLQTRYHPFDATMDNIITMDDVKKASLALQAASLSPKDRADLKNESSLFQDNRTGTTSQAATTPAQDTEDSLKHFERLERLVSTL